MVLGGSGLLKDVLWVVAIVQQSRELIGMSTMNVQCGDCLCLILSLFQVLVQAPLCSRILVVLCMSYWGCKILTVVILW